MDTQFKDSLPSELLVVIAEQLHFFDLLCFERASKYLFNYFAQSNTWKKHYQAISRCDDVSVISINIWWQSEVPRAQAYSTLLKVDRASRTTTNKALRYLTPSYKSYIKVLVEHKRITRKDLKLIDTRSDLTTHEKKVAFDLYWLIHMKFPKLTFGLYASEIEYWNPDRQRYLFPDDLQHLADHKPLFIWEDCDGDNYYQYYWIFWLRSDDSIAMYMPMCNGKTLRGQRLLTFTIEEFAQVTAPQLLFELPTGERGGIQNSIRTATKSKIVFPIRQDIHTKMGDELMWKLDRAASNVIESVKVSPKVSNVKKHCDTWLSGLEDKQSPSTKAAIIRFFRRALWFLLNKEIIQHSACAPAIHVYEPPNWKKLFHNGVTDHMPPKYWALYLIEKAYYCVDPLAEMLIQLLANESTTASCTKLITIGIDSTLVDKVILAFHAKLTE